MEKIPGLDLNVDIVMKGAKKMEKVKLTQEQVVALQRFSSDSAVIKRAVHGFDSPYHKCLEKLTLDELCRVLYTPNSYEVMPHYKVRDWITVFNVDGVFKYTAQITSIDGDYVTVVRQNTLGYDLHQDLNGYDVVRHATPEEIQQEKERRWWDEHGREVWELREGDTLKDEINYPHFVTRGNRTDGGLERTPSLNCVFREMDEIKSRFEVACFVEQRLDK